MLRAAAQRLSVASGSTLSRCPCSFSKFCLDCEVVDGKVLSPHDVTLAFQRVRAGTRRWAPSHPYPALDHVRAHGAGSVEAHLLPLRWAVPSIERCTAGLRRGSGGAAVPGVDTVSQRLSLPSSRLRSSGSGHARQPRWAARGAHPEHDHSACTLRLEPLSGQRPSLPACPHRGPPPLLACSPDSRMHGDSPGRTSPDHAGCSARPRASPPRAGRPSHPP